MNSKNTLSAKKGSSIYYIYIYLLVVLEKQEIQSTENTLPHSSLACCVVVFRYRGNFHKSFADALVSLKETMVSIHEFRINTV